MEINLKVISAFLKSNRITDGEKLIQFDGHEIGFKPKGSDSIGGTFLGWRNEKQQKINNQVRDKFLKFVLKLFNAKDVTKLPEGVKKAMELNDYCGIFGSVRSLTAKGGTSTGKPLSLRRIRAVMQAITDCRKSAVSRINQAIILLQKLSSSSSAVREMRPVSHLMAMEMTKESVAVLESVRAVIAKGAAQGEIDGAIESLHVLASKYGQVSKHRSDDAKEKKHQRRFDEARQYDLLANFAKSARVILERIEQELGGLYNVSASKPKPKPKNVHEEPVLRNLKGTYCKAIVLLNRFRYSGVGDKNTVLTYEFGRAMWENSVTGRKEPLLNGLKKIIGLEKNPALTAEKRLSRVQEENERIVLTEEDYEDNDVMPLRISDNQVPIPEYTERTQDKKEVEKRRGAIIEAAVKIEMQLKRRLEEKVDQHLVKVGSMNEEELRLQLKKVPIPVKIAEAFAGLYTNGMMTVLERNLIADILKDYGILATGI